MKQLLVAVVMLTSALSIHAQNVLVRDSNYINETGVSVITVYNNSYDANCRLSVSQDYFVNAATQEQTNDKEVDYSYYSDSSIFQVVTKYWSLVTNMYENYSRETYTYTGNKIVATYMVEYWTGTAWTNSILFTYTYTAVNNINNLLTQVWRNSAWLNKKLDIYTYTASNKIMTYLAQSWAKKAWQDDTLMTNTYDAGDRLTDTLTEIRDKKLKMLVNANQTSYTYDNNGYLTGLLSQLWDLQSSKWLEVYATTYYNNSSGLADSTITTDTVNILKKDYYTYYPSSGKLRQTTFYTYAADTLKNGIRETFYYDTTSNSYKDSSAVKELLPSMDSTFKLHFSYVNTTIKNTDGTVSEHDFTQTSYVPSKVVLTNNSFFTYKPCPSVLPVTLLSFGGQLQNGNALLRWQTANETNTAYFTIQRSTDGIHFTSIGTIAAAGNSAVLQNYSYTDAQVVALNTPQLYYRLMETDKDGVVNNSKIVNLNLIADKLSVYVSPNPVKDFIVIHSGMALNNAVITVADMSGKILYTLRQNIAAGGQVPVDASMLAKGIYIVTVQSAADKKEFKIIK